jgi:hypothetical protein
MVAFARRDRYITVAVGVLRSRLLSRVGTRAAGRMVARALSIAFLGDRASASAR